MSKRIPACPKQIGNIFSVGKDIGRKNLPVLMKNHYGDARSGTPESLLVPQEESEVRGNPSKSGQVKASTH